MSKRDAELKRLPVVLEKEVKRQKKLNEGIEREIDELIARIKHLKKSLVEGDTEPKEVLKELKQCVVKVEEVTGSQTDEKSKYLAEVIEDTSDLFSTSSLYHEFDDEGEPWLNRKELVLSIVAEHLFHTGRVATGSILESETGTTVDSDYKAKYDSLHKITTSIEKKEISLLHAWLLQAKAEWKAQWSDQTPSPKIAEYVNDLEFQIYRLHIIGLLKKGNRKEAMTYIKEHLPTFVDGKWKGEVSKLVGALVFISANGEVVESSPYEFLLNDNMELWTDLRNSFRECWCYNSNAPRRPHLSTCLDAGFQALPTLQKYLSLPESFRKTKELHAPPLSTDMVFRSSITCPVTQQVTTSGSGTNPAMLLPCCHVLSRSAIGSLIRPPSNILKCPYCPNECKHSSCQPLFI
eukprot:TRINITY_DN12787_c0_g3_i1.p1 TRINITY_DN12787_c0_g3~~TRINITY_DN12787_c0_g3_i1.p1  ORF type:complete len:407 (+),score=69.87 TRINITY_DN12787_c0_g3_i1:67-1287(+)